MIHGTDYGSICSKNARRCILHCLVIYKIYRVLCASSDSISKLRTFHMEKTTALKNEGEDWFVNIGDSKNRRHTVTYMKQRTLTNNCTRTDAYSWRAFWVVNGTNWKPKSINVSVHQNNSTLNKLVFHQQSRQKRISSRVIFTRIRLPTIQVSIFVASWNTLRSTFCIKRSFCSL